MFFLLFGAHVANAAVVRNSGCDFHVKAQGSHSGSLGQLHSGQVRFGDIPQTPFRIDAGKMWDQQGRGCWWTPPTHVLQCDTNQAPAPGFVVGCDGQVSFNGQTTFYQCVSGDKDQWNIYLDNNQGKDCGPVTLTADGCHANCAPPAPPAPPKGCPADLNGAYEFPHLIVPVDKSNPTKAGGTSYFGEVTPGISSIFNFDIPAGDAGKTCSLIFLLPQQSQLETSSFTASGDGMIEFSMLDGSATEGTSWSNRPRKKTDYGTLSISPGHGYSIATFACPGGQRIAFELDSTSTRLKYFQDYNPAPLGLYIRKC